MTCTVTQTGLICEYLKLSKRYCVEHGAKQQHALVVAAQRYHTHMLHTPIELTGAAPALFGNELLGEAEKLCDAFT